MNVDNIPHVITAACILHNIWEVHGEHFNGTWLQNMDSDYDQPETVDRDTATGPPQNVRISLIEYFWQN